MFKELFTWTPGGMLTACEKYKPQELNTIPYGFTSSKAYGTSVI